MLPELKFDAVKENVDISEVRVGDTILGIENLEPSVGYKVGVASMIYDNEIVDSDGTVLAYDVDIIHVLKRRSLPTTLGSIVIVDGVGYVLTRETIRDRSMLSSSWPADEITTKDVWVSVDSSSEYSVSNLDKKDWKLGKVVVGE